MNACSFHLPRPPPNQTDIRFTIKLTHSSAIESVQELVHAHEGHRDPHYAISDEYTMFITFTDPPGLEPELVRLLTREIAQLPHVQNVTTNDRRV